MLDVEIEAEVGLQEGLWKRGGEVRVQEESDYKSC